MFNFKRLKELIEPLPSGDDRYASLLKDIGQRRFVLLGEATHGTAEFYRERANLTKVLIEKHGFNAVVIEGDWPDSYEINQYVNGYSNHESAASALIGFDRFPTWMWRNEDIQDFVDWLKCRNELHQGLSERVRFYGMDLYSLFKSIDIVKNHLIQMDRDLWEKAKKRFSCFDYANRDAQLYGYLANYSSREHSCELEVIEQLHEMLHKKEYLFSLGEKSDDIFSTIQNARLIHNAENYYRQMYRGGVSSWNLRDSHMFEIVCEIDHYLTKLLQNPSKIIIWAHNSHVGDARATQQGQSGELNVGQLMRDHFSSQVYLLGFTTYAGYVTAASEWGAAAERKKVNIALPGSYENIFHQMGFEQCLLLFNKNKELSQLLPSNYLERAIGVIYLPHSERRSHYFYANLPEQFDAVIHIDTTRAVKPLEKFALFELEDAPETYPSGF